MRWALAAAVLAVAGAVYLLAPEGGGPRPQPTKPPRGAAPPTPEGGGEQPPGALPDPEKEPRGFVDEATRRAEVAPLLAFLRSGRDKQLAPLWRFDPDGSLVGHPTLRACYLAALSRIESEEATTALREALANTASVEETYVIAQALSTRGSPGWARTALERADARGLPAQRPVRLALVELAAAKDPELAARLMVERAPRGDDARVPRVLAHGLGALPIENATAAIEALLTDQDVTNRTRGVYLKALCAREELDAIRALTGLAERRDLDPKTAVEACYAAAGAAALDLDRLAAQQALADGDAARAARARERLQRRRNEIKTLIQAALALDIDTSEAPQAQALKRLLDRNQDR